MKKRQMVSMTYGIFLSERLKKSPSSVSSKASVATSTASILQGMNASDEQILASMAKIEPKPESSEWT